MTVTFVTNFGQNNFVTNLVFLKMDVSFNQLIFYSLNKTYLIDNDWWRLITPVFIHFSFSHIIFNCLWIYVLGKNIERIDGKIIFLILFLFAGIFSNFAQYYFGGVSLFGGLSGVVFGLLGFCMINELNTKHQKYDLPEAIYIFMIVWMILGFFGVLELFGFGNIANYAHLGGLFSGIILSILINFYKNTQEENIN
jgi:GlpG protein